MNRILTDNIKAIENICEKHNVKEMYAFGSVSTGRFTEQSDIDLLISFNPMNSIEYADNYFEIADKFEELFGRPVDLITDKSLSNPYFIKSVNETRVRIYG
jgi:uncharacterized protein